MKQLIKTLEGTSPEVDPLEVVLGDGPVPELKGLQLILEVPGSTHFIPDGPQRVLDVLDL